MCLSIFNKNKLDLNDVQALLEAMGHTLPEALSVLDREREEKSQAALSHEVSAQEIEEETEEEYQRALAAAMASRKSGLSNARHERGLAIDATRKAQAATQLLTKLKS